MADLAAPLVPATAAGAPGSRSPVESWFRTLGTLVFDVLAWCAFLCYLTYPEVFLHCGQCFVSTGNFTATSAGDCVAVLPQKISDGYYCKNAEETHFCSSTPGTYAGPCAARQEALGIDAWLVLWLERGIILAAVIAWRVARVLSKQEKDDVPYTCGVVKADGRELYLVATLHISPKAPLDVEAVINSKMPDVTLIELDDERLERMRDKPQELKDLQPVTIQLQGGGGLGGAAQPTVVQAQRALWNGEWSGERIAGQVVLEPQNEYGAQPLVVASAPTGAAPHLALVRRGGPTGGKAVTFALKAHNAAKGGAAAVLVVNYAASRMPPSRLGTGPLTSDLKLALQTCSCGLPPVPVLLLPHAEGMQLMQLCEKENAQGGSGGAPRAEFQILPDTFPRRTLRKRICQAFALMFSGIGILYGIIGCFGVEVGAEFTVAEEVAAQKGIPCACIDVNMDMLWSRLASSLLPTPCNLLNAVLSWLAFPRLALRFLFPSQRSVDVLGSTVLHLKSLSLRTWLAFVVSGFCASWIMSHILQLLSASAERAGEATGAVSQQDRSDATTYLMLAIELYLFPQVYAAIAASRDEAMYNGIVDQAEKFSASRVVAVVGAAHSNGILERVRARGLARRPVANAASGERV
eukprot:TRINITY_DN13577_c1_g3_i1.p1 TRINITY_DN13577_c1_g3~~TRINITY_DN13577_c1_g3_i1.p1  ORF type:complete len:702 (-),score=156.77 TRINITY_DN13577_c1_g3_i1:71-1978(-)